MTNEEPAGGDIVTTLRTLAKPKKPIGPMPKHEFVRRDNADGSHADRKCVECGLDERNPVHGR